MRLNPSVLATSPPPIPLAQAWRAAYDPLTYGPLLDLSQGVPASPPPRAFSSALARIVLDDGRASARYGPILGERPLREALVDEWRDVYDAERSWPAAAAAPATAAAADGAGAGVGPDDIAIVCGANMAFIAVLQTLCSPGDVVLLPSPAYFNHPMTLSLLGLQALELPCSPRAGYAPSLEEARRVVERFHQAKAAGGGAGGGDLKAIVLVSPNNPTGKAYPPALIEGFRALADDWDLALVIDETYRDFVGSGDGPPTAAATGAGHPLGNSDVDDGGDKTTIVTQTTTTTTTTGDDGPPRATTAAAAAAASSSPQRRRRHRSPPHRLFSSPTWRQTVISLFSFSKSYCLPGHRLGAIVASPTFLASAGTVLDCLQIHAPRPAQLALAEVVRSCRAGVLDRSRTYGRLLERFERALPEGWEVRAKGAFYAYVRHPFGRRRRRGGRRAKEATTAAGAAAAAAGTTATAVGGDTLAANDDDDDDDDGRPSPSSQTVARVLGETYGIVILPGSFFQIPPALLLALPSPMPTPTPTTTTDDDDDDADEDDCLRFAVANVTEHELDLLGRRLALVSRSDFD